MRLNTFQDFLQHEKRYSEHTVQAYIADIAQCFHFFIRTFDTSDPGEITHALARSWMVELLETGVKARTVNRKLSSLRTYFRFLRQNGTVDINPFEKITGPKMAKRLPTVIEQNALELLFNHVDFDPGYKGARDRLILELLYSAGLRKSEVIGLRLEQVDFSRETLHIIGKGKKTRMIPFAGNLKKALRHYIDLRNSEFEVSDSALLLTDKGRPLYPKFVFNKVHKYLSMVTTSDKRGPHTLRHSFATHLTDEGADINAIKELLGHSSLAATQVYTHTSIKRLKSSYDKAHPKA